MAEIAAINPEALPDVRLRPHPAAGLVRSDHPIGTIWSAHQAEGVIVRAIAEAVLVTRPVLNVKVTVIPSADAAFADVLLQGSVIGDAVERTVGKHPEFDFGRALTGLCSLSAFSQAVLP